MVQHPCYTCPEIREGEACILYKETKVKAAVKLYQNRDPATKMVGEFVERVESKGYQSMTKEAGKYAEEYGPQLQLKHPDPVCVTEEGEVVPG